MKTFQKKLSLLLVVFMLSAVALSAKEFTVIIFDEINQEYVPGCVRIVTYEGGDVSEDIDGYALIEVPGETLNYTLVQPREGYITTDCEIIDDIIIFYIRPVE